MTPTKSALPVWSVSIDRNSYLQLKAQANVAAELQAALTLVLEHYDGEHGEPGVIGCQTIAEARTALAKCAKLP